MHLPKLRFKDDDGKEFPEWETRKIGELGRFIGGGTPTTQNEDFWNGNIPWISSSDLSEESIFQIKTSRFISEKAISQSATKLVPRNGILVVSRVGVGKVAIAKENICTSQDFTNLVLHSGNHVFFAYLIKTKTNRLLEFNQGTSIKGFVKSDFEDFEISVPVIQEQTKIANFLTAIDEKITQLTQKYDLLKQYKKGVMQQIFSQKLRFKDDDGRDFPEWEVKKLSDINIYISDGNYGEQYPNSEQLKQFGVPFIRANNISGLSLTWADMKYMDHALHEVLTSGHLETDDILVTTRGDIGMVGYVNSEFHGSNINAQICLLRVINKSKLNTRYLLQLLSSAYCQKQFKELQTGSALKQLPKKNLMQIEILSPLISEQTKIANFLTAIDDKITHTQTQLEAVKLYKKGLLQQLFV